MTATGLGPGAIAGLADVLEACARNACATLPLTDAEPDMTLEDAYAIQAELVRRQQARGARIVGLTAGQTSHAKMRQMQVDSPVFGVLMAEGCVADGATVSMSGLIHPRAEPEICFVLRSTLAGPGCHIGAVLAATDFVLPGIEVIDSRYRGFDFDARSLVADNTSAARFTVGGQGRRPDQVDLRTVGIVLEKNGEPAGLGAGAAVLGHPAAAVAMLANHLGRRGQVIPAGTMIMSGAITEAIPVRAGDHVRLRVQAMGSVSLRFA